MAACSDSFAKKSVTPNSDCYKQTSYDLKKISIEIKSGMLKRLNPNTLARNIKRDNWLRYTMNIIQKRPIGL